MPRKARYHSISGIYHIMLRGADRRIIFADDEDCEKFLEILGNVKQKSGFNMFAYCLMGNHVHLLIKEIDEPLGLIFKRLGASYVYYYNWKYQLHGHLWQDRFRSEAIDGDAYFLDVIRYICQNPVKAGLSSSPEEYRWLGCSGIKDDQNLLDPIIDYTDLRRDSLLQFISESCSNEHLEDGGNRRWTDREAIQLICDCCNCSQVQEIGGWEKVRMEAAIITCLKKGISIRQLSRLTAISKSKIEKLSRN